jgi:hypothetical protein
VPGTGPLHAACRSEFGRKSMVALHSTGSHWACALSGGQCCPMLHCITYGHAASVASAVSLVWVRITLPLFSLMSLA